MSHLIIGQFFSYRNRWLRRREFSNNRMLGSDEIIYFVPKRLTRGESLAVGILSGLKAERGQKSQQRGVA